MTCVTSERNYSGMSKKKYKSEKSVLFATKQNKIVANFIRYYNITLHKRFRGGKEPLN